MKRVLAARIAILLVATVAVAGALIFAWPELEQRQAAPASPSPAPKTTPIPARPPAPVASAADTLKRLTDQVAPRTDRTDRAPSFDVARIEPDGETVIGGQAAPGATVELLRGGVPHARTVAGPSGDFVFVPKPLPPGSYDLTLRATLKDGTISMSKDSVAVVLRSRGKEKPVVALTEPGKPAVVLSKPNNDAAGTAELAIDAVEGEAGGRMYVSGHATPGAKVNLYLNDAYIATGTASAEGRIAFSIRGGIRPGDYRVRLDQVDASARVQKRVEVPFKAPAMLAASTPPKRPASGATADTTASISSRPAASPRRAAAQASAAAPSPATTPPPAATPTPAAAGAKPRESSEPAQRVTSAPPAANPESAAPPTSPSPHENASTPPGQPTPAPATPKPAASQQTASGDVTPQPPAASAAASDKGTDVVVVPHVDTALVVRGDSLWRISQNTYGEGVRYSVIYKANRDQIRNPDLIYPGQIFVLPKEQP